MLLGALKIAPALGVVGAIIPWNAPVLCAGNTLVLKTAEDAPLGALAQHPTVRKLSFTGSTEVGKVIMHAAAERIAPVSLELGGKSPSIVYPDADKDWVVDGVIAGMRFPRQSQSCTAGSRLFLHTDIFESFLDKLRAKTQALKLGDPLDEATDIGSIINNKQFTKVCGYVEEGLQRKDAHLVFGGLPPKEGPLSEGYFAIPTVFAGTSNDWRLAREEIFGPVLVAIPWTDEADAIRMANDSHYGLAAYVWTHDIGSGLRAAHSIESGWVQVNQGGGQSPGHSYGGYKQSGIGREFSLEGMLDSFTQRKNVTVNLNTPGRV
jgi:betaine-aldehyde dehydrogenase